MPLARQRAYRPHLAASEVQLLSKMVADPIPTATIVDMSGLTAPLSGYRLHVGLQFVADHKVNHIVL
ncbi:MAG: hypothetical protein O2901_14015, partial [Verrucomicrobia bacterium]|nr:hypothetical protein [Verrucomicrobiota bacterium]